MNVKQYRTGKQLLESFFDKEWIGKQDLFDIESVLEYFLEGEKEFGIRFLNSLETLPREKGYQILETIGAIQKKITGKINSRTTGIPFLFRGQEVTILNCEEIDEEAELYMYEVELDYHGRKYTTWINSEDIKI